VRPEVWAVVSALLGAAVVWLGEFVWHFARARIVQERVGLAVAEAGEKYLRRELVACVERSAHPPWERGETLNKPVGLKVASLQWHARNPEIQDQLERCQAEVERLRKIIRDMP
jgi:hypothetical protein